MSDNKDINESLEPIISPMEARILGALMEKQLTTPDTYPLTLNSLQLACNQKTSREPVSNYEPGEIQNCLNSLQERKLVDVDWGARAARYDQRLTRVYSMDKAAQAILCIMLLRGPQTLNELLTRTQRMYEFSSTGDIAEKLEQLCAKTTPLFALIPRQSGQREDRYTHLFCGAPDLTQLSQSNESSGSRPALELDSLLKRIEQLEQQVTALTAEVQQLKSNS